MPTTPPRKVLEAAESHRFGRLITMRLHRKSILIPALGLLLVPILLGAAYLLAETELRFLRSIVQVLACFGPVVLIVFAIKSFTVRPCTWMYEGGMVTTTGAKYPLITPWAAITSLQAMNTKGSPWRPGDELWGYRATTTPGHDLAWPTENPEQDAFVRELLGRVRPEVIQAAT